MGAQDWDSLAFIAWVERNLFPAGDTTPNPGKYNIEHWSLMISGTRGTDTWFPVFTHLLATIKPDAQKSQDIKSRS